MTMANTENTSEKKTIRKRARPLRGAGGTVTEEAKEKKTKNNQIQSPFNNGSTSPWFLTPLLGSPSPDSPFLDDSI